MTIASTSPPDVTIVVIAHSVRDELKLCLESIEHCAGVPTETIYVDNASTDGSADWVEAAHLDVTVVRLAKNIGVAARDEGLRRARGRYVMFLDSDAALTPVALPDMVAAMDAHPGWGLLGPRLVYDDGELQLSCRRYPPFTIPLLRRPPLSRWFENGPTVRHHLMADEPHDITRPVFYVLGACQLFRRDLARRAGPFEQGVFLGWDDGAWCVRIRDAGGEIVYFPEATVIHSYRRMTKAAPLSKAARHHLRAHVAMQWRYRGRRPEFRRLEAELDRRALKQRRAATTRSG